MRHETEYSKPGRLKSICINARSIVNKINDLQAIMESCDPDVVGICESWANSNVFDSELSIEGYDLFRVDRQEARGGGVLLYTRPTLQAIEFFPTTKFPEQVWCRIPTTAGGEQVIGVCYVQVTQ